MWRVEVPARRWGIAALCWMLPSSGLLPPFPLTPWDGDATLPLFNWAEKLFTCVFAAEEQLHYNFICVPWNLFMCLKSLSQVSSDFIPLNALICLLWIPYNITPTDALAEVEVCVWQELMDPSWIWEMCRLEPYPASPPLIWQAIMQWEYAGEIVKLREGTESKWCCKHLERDLKTTIHKLSSWHLKQKNVWKSLYHQNIACVRKM